MKAENVSQPLFRLASRSSWATYILNTAVIRDNSTSYTGICAEAVSVFSRQNVHKMASSSSCQKPFRSHQVLFNTFPHPKQSEWIQPRLLAIILPRARSRRSSLSKHMIQNRTLSKSTLPNHPMATRAEKTTQVVTLWPIEIMVYGLLMAETFSSSNFEKLARARSSSIAPPKAPNTSTSTCTPELDPAWRMLATALGRLMGQISTSSKPKYRIDQC